MLLQVVSFRTICDFKSIMLKAQLSMFIDQLPDERSDVN